jgi:hypothetical protein
MEQFTGVLQLRGSLRIALQDPDGKLLEERIINNLIVTAGRAWVLGQLETVNQNTAQTISYIAVGSNTTPPTTADSALGNEVTRLPISSFLTVGLANNPPSWTATVTLATNQGNTTLGEVGLFNSSAAGTMLGHATFSSFVKATSNTLNISYTISG